MTRIVSSMTILMMMMTQVISPVTSDDSDEFDDCSEEAVDCSSDLRTGQFLCLDLDIDPATQQLRGCQIVDGEARALQRCSAIEGIVCAGSCNSSFSLDVGCEWTNDYQFDTALLLSVFLGMFGADRFYLGYPAIGLLKFSTLGFFFIGHLVDIILIATQSLGPADGSHYVISYFGAGLRRVTVSEATHRREQADWY